MNTNRWLGRRGQRVQMEPNPKDPINLLAKYMDDEYGPWYQSLPLAVTGDINRFRTLCQEIISTIYDTEDSNDNGVGPECITAPMPCVDDEPIPF